jgi:DNA-binding NtrC family response regulator
MAASNSPRILVVDDEEIVLVALQEVLRREHYEVISTGDPAVALAELKKRPFAVIITDQRMPELTGLELLAQARQIQPDATRILITAVLSLDTVIDAFNATTSSCKTRSSSRPRRPSTNNWSV